MSVAVPRPHADSRPLTIVGVAVVRLRSRVSPRRAWDGHDAFEHQRAAAIVAEHGRDTLAPFVLRDDKAFFFTRGGMLAYRTLGRTAVVSSDPIGPAGAAPEIVSDFLSFASERGWEVAIAAAGPEHLARYRALGLRAIQVGAEAVVDPQAFTLAGRAVRKLRQSVHRVERRGWRVEVVAARALGRDRIDELGAAEAEWRASAPRRDGFAMSMDRLWGGPEDRDDIYVLGRAPDGALRAFLRFVPYRAGLSLDAMRRLGDEPNGLTEAMIVAALEHARDARLAEVSLNFAGFAHVMASDTRVTRSQRALRWVLRRMHGRFQLERLVQFNDKFSPAWRPRFLVYAGRTRLPLAGVRVLQAESYLPAPPTRRPAWGWAASSLPVAVEPHAITRATTLTNC